MRPPGYEPGELPTAPLRDVFLKRVQRYDYFLKQPNILHKNRKLLVFLLFLNRNIWSIARFFLLLHTIRLMCNP